MLFITYGFGTSEFPSPTAQLFGFLVTSLYGLSSGQLPGTGDGVVLPFIGELVFPWNIIYLIAFGVIGGLAGRYLLRKGLSPISLAVGILIPPATALAMLVGGFFDYRIKKKREMMVVAGGSEPEDLLDEQKKTGRMLSGAISGEAIVTVIFVLWTAFMFFAAAIG